MTMTNARISVRPAASETSVARFAEDVRYYLTLAPRQLPSRYLYDALGSALFDAICQLPWYGLTRAEMRLLDAHAPKILDALHPLRRVVELGAGSGDKLAALMGAAAAPSPASLELHLIDVSPRALEDAARALAGFDGVRVVLHQAPYDVGLRQLADDTRPAGRTLLLFLGSNIGNFDPPGAEAMLRQIRAALRRGDGFLIGADLVKPEAQLLLAYDDPLQVTAAFNRNLLVRINRELDADFDLDGFAHRAVWNAAQLRVEMHLVSTRAQRVAVPAADLELTLAEGETIWIESSYKYEPESLVEMLAASGFVLQQQWIDETERFALTLVRVD